MENKIVSYDIQKINSILAILDSLTVTGARNMKMVLDIINTLQNPISTSLDECENK